jgi:hypothetical protein
VSSAAPITTEVEDLTIRLAAADLAWCRQYGDPPAEPVYLRHLATVLAQLATGTTPPPADPGQKEITMPHPGIDTAQVRTVLADLLIGNLHRDAARPDVLAAIADHRRRYRATHDEDPWTPADRERLAELVGELGTVAHLLRRDDTPDPGDLHAELVRVAAVALAWLDHLAGRITGEEPSF